MDDVKAKLNLNFYYCLIFVLSLLVLFVAPMFSPNVESGDLGIGMVFPKTPIGWAIFATTKLFVASVNLLLFHCFVKQARLNVRDNQKFIEACAILALYQPANYLPRRPQIFFHQLYRRKGIMIFITSVMSSVVLTNAILAFDLTSFISYLITIVMGIILGILKMKDVEGYWTGEFWDYAKKIEQEHQAPQSE